ncbi:MAG: class I SAM-dependent methyltransferase [Pirellulaceae bacterium]|nr:class I SAM-dependent methyltransferase [Pirellulaceae bacterium]
MTLPITSVVPAPDEVARIVRAAGEHLARRLAPLAAAADAGALGEEDYPAVAAAIDESLGALRTTNLWGPANRLPSSALWSLVGPLLERSLLISRARHKPRGYAGDYEMLAWIHEQRRGDDPLGQLLDRYFQEQAAPVAVRNRMAMMAGWIREAALAAAGPLKIAMVGSAFGWEIKDALASLAESVRERITVTLLDLDPAALEFARRELAPLLPAERLLTAAENLFRLPDRPRAAARLDGIDWLFCPGLFDYLDDEQASAMLGLFWRGLAPRGRLCVFQFAPQNPTRASMEWLGNWYLLYRTAADLGQLAATAGIPQSAIATGAEPLGVDLYLTAGRD